MELHRGRYRWKPRIDGQRTIVPLSATTYEDAVREVLEIKKRGTSKSLSGWEQAVRRYIIAVHRRGSLSATTQENRLSILLAIGRQAGCDSLRSFTPARGAAWLDQLQASENLSATTRHDYVRFLRTFRRWCVAETLRLADPTQGWPSLQPQQNLRDVFIPAADVARLLAAARESADRDLEFILALGCECGMRRGEIDAARPAWFDLANGTVTIPATDRGWKRKGREGQRRAATIPLSQVMLGIIDHYGLPSPYLIAPGKDWGAHRYRFEFRKRVEKFLAAHGFGHVTIHDLRRSFASNRVSAGVSLEKVANWMGIHRNTAWTRYSRFLPADADINRGSAIRTPAAADSPPPAAATTIASRLATLDQLHAEGLITTEERAAKRAAILAEI